MSEGDRTVRRQVVWVASRSSTKRIEDDITFSNPEITTPLATFENEGAGEVLLRLNEPSPSNQLGRPRAVMLGIMFETGSSPDRTSTTCQATGSIHSNRPCTSVAIYVMPCSRRPTQEEVTQLVQCCFESIYTRLASSSDDTVLHYAAASQSGIPWICCCRV
jgi:hypothetical protein